MSLSRKKETVNNIQLNEIGEVHDDDVAPQVLSQHPEQTREEDLQERRPE